jgi:hypothetical protein
MTHNITDSSTTSDTDHEVVIPIDQEHFMIRFLVPVLTIVLVIVTHFVGAMVLAATVEGVTAGCVMLPIDVGVLVAGGYTIERILKRVLPSRRSARLSDTALTIIDARTKPPAKITFDWRETVNVRAWRFEVPRRTRVPKGWYCMALYLLQDETEAVLYTFMPPVEAENVIGYHQFVRLRPRKETESNTDLNAVAEQRRLLKLEDIRWDDGAEIKRDDFRALLAVMQRRVPGWY